MVAAASLGSVLRGELPESEAFGFYQRTDRRAYERMVLLVSAFYETYRGRDYHFYNAQRLSLREKQDLRLHESFVRIVACIEDLDDAQDAAYDLAISELIGGLEPGDSPFRPSPQRQGADQRAKRDRRHLHTNGAPARTGQSRPSGQRDVS